MKPKKLYPFLFTLLLTTGLIAQNVGVGTSTPNAVLEVKATNPASPANTDGIIIPRIDIFPAVNPTVLQHGMLVYLTTTAGINQPGFYYWDNASTSWIALSGAASGTSWNITGNTGTSPLTHFIGTTDDNDIVFKRNAMLSGKIGVVNTAFGYQSLFSTTYGAWNTAMGVMALYSNTGGYNNTAMGNWALNSNVTGSDNTAIGHEALFFNTGSENVAVGSRALYLNTTGSKNTAIGRTLHDNTTGVGNSAIGYALNASTSGDYNNAIGYDVLNNNTSGSGNNAIGKWALRNNLTGSNNIAIGTGVGSSLTTGSSNTIIGTGAGSSLTTGSNNTIIGTGAGPFLTTGSNNTAIGFNAYVPEGNNKVSIANMIFATGDNGYVGVSTSVPEAPLHVRGAAVGLPNQIRSYFHANTSNIVQDVSSTSNIVLRADGWIWSNLGGFVATSDARIKNIIGATNTQTDLATLQKIQVTDYRYKDEIGQGSGLQKKVVAQQVKEIYPIAVHQSAGVIPNVFELAKSVKVIDKSTAITTNKPHGFATGDEVKLILDKSGEKTYAVTVTAPDSFTIPAAISESVFVYGKKVTDLLNVDYDALTTLNISATQQLVKEIEKVKADLQQQIDNLLKRLEPVVKK